MQVLSLATEALRFSVGFIVTCNAFVYIEDRVLSLNYLNALLDDLTFRIYLQILLHADGNKGGTKVGHKQFKNIYRNCSLKKYNICIDILVKYGLITTRRLTKTIMLKIPLLAPLWLEEQKTFVDTSTFYRSKRNLLFYRRTFVLVPKEALDTMLRDRSLSLITVKLILKLYKYFLSSTFNGIDPNVIHLRGRELYYDQRIFHDLGIGESDIPYYLAEIAPYFQAKETTVHYESLDMEERLMLCEGSGKDDDHIKITVLVPLFQYDKDTNETTENSSSKASSSAKGKTPIWELLGEEKPHTPTSSS